MDDPNMRESIMTVACCFLVVLALVFATGNGHGNGYREATHECRTAAGEKVKP